jgi:hypothetical protein
MRTHGGHEFKEEFIGRFIVEDPSSPSPRLEYFNVWIVSLHPQNLYRGNMYQGEGRLKMKMLSVRNVG